MYKKHLIAEACLVEGTCKMNAIVIMFIFKGRLKGIFGLDVRGSMRLKGPKVTLEFHCQSLRKCCFH